MLIVENVNALLLNKINKYNTKYRFWTLYLWKYTKFDCIAHNSTPIACYSLVIAHVLASFQFGNWCPIVWKLILIGYQKKIEFCTSM